MIIFINPYPFHRLLGVYTVILSDMIFSGAQNSSSCRAR